MRILSLPVDKGGCGWLRVRQPLAILNQDPEIETHVIDNYKDDFTKIFQALCLADILVVRQGGDVGVDRLRKAVAEGQKESGLPQRFPKVVFDIDDNIERISPYSEHYKEYGQREFVHEGKKIWEDGLRGFDLAKNRTRVEHLLNFMTKADMISVTTPKLAEYAKQYNPNVAVLPNSIDPDKWWPLETKPHKKLRVGWSGGVSHYEDWYTIKEPLNKLMREFQFTLVSVGAHFSGVIDEDNKHLVEVHPWVPFEAHSYHMMAMDLDIAVIPLADLPFNHYKSAVKWMEFSMLGIPSVVSHVTPYKEVTKHGFTALTYKDQNQFYHTLRDLLITPKMRETIGKNARQRALQHHNAKRNASIWKETYQHLIDKD